MTTSRSLVKQTLEFAGPDRVPRELWLLPWASIHHPEMVREIETRFPADIMTAPWCLRRMINTKGDPYAQGTHVDEWGCTFTNLLDGVIGEVKEPLLPHWHDLEKISLPTELLTSDPDRVNHFCRETDRFVLAPCCPRPFERLQFIRGTENLLLDLAEQPAELFTLIDKLHNFYLDKLALWATTDVDGIMFMDDWGSQQNLLISPAMWRRIFKPLYRDYIDLIHRAGKYAFMHSDGHILKIIPDLVELGLDALNSQIFCMGLPALQLFRGQLTFWGELDRQHLLPAGTKGEIKRAAKEMGDHLFQHGGLIAQCEFGPGAQPENVFTFFAAFE